MRLSQRGDWIRDVLEKPHHPDVVEGGVLVGQFDRVGPTKVGAQAESREMGAGRLELPLLDVHPGERDLGKGLAEDA
jgi:hypothetical protein